jgi:hypothetical protein
VVFYVQLYVYIVEILNNLAIKREENMQKMLQYLLQHSTADVTKTARENKKLNSVSLFNYKYTHSTQSCKNIFAYTYSYIKNTNTCMHTCTHINIHKTHKSMHAHCT